MQVNSGFVGSGRERAYEYLRDHVLTDPQMQGQFINEQQLAEAVGVSRTPVREALLLFVADGLVEMIPKRGAQIPIVSGRQVSELMELRGVLERHAAAASVRDGNAPTAAMRAILADQFAMKGASVNDSGRRFIDLDSHFHQLLVDSIENDLISQTYAKLRVRQVLVGVEALYRTADRQAQVCDEHEAIVAGLEAADAEATQEAIDSHLAVTLDVLLRA